MPNSDGVAHLRLVARPHPINAWVLRPAARPFARVDGQEYPMRWGRELSLPVPAGEHVVETFLRYRGTRADLGVGRLTVTAAAGDDLHLHARNGWANHLPLRPALTAT